MKNAGRFLVAAALLTPVAFVCWAAPPDGVDIPSESEEVHDRMLAEESVVDAFRRGGRLHGVLRGLIAEEVKRQTPKPCCSACPPCKPRKAP
jgi:hypothetical protein